MDINQIDINAAARLKELVERASKIVITAHMSPDGDAVGSTLGLYHVLKAMGKEATVIVPDDVTRQLAFLPGENSIVIYCRSVKAAQDIIAEADLIFCLDYNAPMRIDRLAPEIMGVDVPRVLIDHHLDPEQFCDLMFSYPEASSTCHVLYYVIQAMGYGEYIGMDAATCIMCGMMTDTGNFNYNANDPNIYYVVGSLMELGVDRNDLSRRLFDTFSDTCLKLNAYAIYRKMQVFKDFGAALITLSRDELNSHHYRKGDTEGLVNKPLAIPEVIYSVFLREESDYIKVSMRSKGSFPCDQICAKYFGGGGHANAAGGEFRGTMEQAVEVFRSLLPQNKKLVDKARAESR